jgi:hypothetical protein
MDAMNDRRSFIKGAIGAALLGPTAGEIQAKVAPVDDAYPVGHAWRYLTPAQLSAVKAYSFDQDCTAALQDWLDAAWCSNVSAYLPGGGYLISGTLHINRGYTLAGVDYRGVAFRVFGDGAGSVEAMTALRTTVIQSVTDAVMLRYEQYKGVNTDSGAYFIEGIRFVQSSSEATAPVVELDNLGVFSRFSQCDIYQAGSGDGLRCLELTQATIERCTIINRDWVAGDAWLPTVSYAVGSTVINGVTLYQCTRANTREAPPNSAYWRVHERVATGVNIFSRYNAGMGTIRNVSVRGFARGFTIGDPSGHTLFGVTVRECDVSNVSCGLTINANQHKTHVENCYFEGVEATNILDEGSYSVARDNIILTASFNQGIDASAAGGGNLYDGNEVSMGTQYLDGIRHGVPNAVGIIVAGSASRPMTVTNNQFVWGHSGTGVANVVGLRLTGIDALISHHGNSFHPASGWSGGGTTAAFVDATTSSTGSSGSGVKGFGVGLDRTSSFPRMSRGSLGYWYDPTALGNAAVSGGVLTLSQATDHTVTFTTPQTITSINPAVCEEGHVYVCHFTNGLATLTPGANLRLANSTSFTPSSQGATLTFRMKDNVAYEIGRAAY